MSSELRAGEFISCIPVANVTKIEKKRMYAVVGRQLGSHVKYLQLEEQRLC